MATGSATKRTTSCSQTRTLTNASVVALETCSFCASGGEASVWGETVFEERAAAVDSVAFEVSRILSAICGAVWVECEKEIENASGTLTWNETGTLAGSSPSPSPSWSFSLEKVL